MKIKPGYKFLVEGVNYTVLKRAPISGLWVIFQTYNPVAKSLFKDEKWIKDHANIRKKSP